MRDFESRSIRKMELYEILPKEEKLFLQISPQTFFVCKVLLIPGYPILIMYNNCILFIVSQKAVSYKTFMNYQQFRQNPVEILSYSY